MIKKLFAAGFTGLFLLSACNFFPETKRAEMKSTAEATTTAESVPASAETERASTMETTEVKLAVPAEKALPAGEITTAQAVPDWIKEDSGADRGGPRAPLAKCLTSKGVRMYGAYWCPHCADQKDMFGADFRFIEYLECDPQGENNQAARCEQDKVTSYPTWYFPESGYDPGTKPLEKIARLGGCESYL